MNTRIKFDEAKKLVDSFPHWHHSFEIYPGIVTSGAYNAEFLMKKLNLPYNLKGKRVLDLGACNGYFSRELDKRGANVTAVDYRSKDLSGFSRMEKLYGKRISSVSSFLGENGFVNSQFLVHFISCFS